MKDETLGNETNPLSHPLTKNQKSRNVQFMNPSMSTIPELSARLRAILDEDKQCPLNQFALELSGQVRAFLKEELHASFPTIQLSLRYGESYRESLREVGVPDRSIKGSSGMYIGNVFSGQIFVDLEGVKQFLLEGQTTSAIVFLCSILTEEFCHSLAPKVSDAQMADQTIMLTEKFIKDFKHTEEQKKAIRESFAGEAKDGLFEPEFDSRGSEQQAK